MRLTLASLEEDAVSVRRAIEAKSLEIERLKADENDVRSALDSLRALMKRRGVIHEPSQSAPILPMKAARTKGAAEDAKFESIVLDIVDAAFRGSENGRLTLSDLRGAIVEVAPNLVSGDRLRRFLLSRPKRGYRVTGYGRGAYWTKEEPVTPEMETG